MATDGIEREFKLLLTSERERAALEALLPPPKRRLRQRNLFFDTADGAVGRAGHSLRLREEGGRWTLTAKGPCLKPLPGPTRRREAERVVPAHLARHLEAGTADPLPLLRRASPPAIALALARAIEEAAAGAPLLPRGSFRNERAEIPLRLPPGLPAVLALDRTAFDDETTELEVELELEDDGPAEPAEAWLADLFTRAGIPRRPAPSKRARFEARRNAANGH
ncbi:CYTH domain-containing protein [Elioraea thermophila]|uniref:CYTH domain-containing protein n=1 Tax=Elioraea thermophila TaxID=2185104 RepID=UPI0013003091|nr:CYTH domain-containing protein [Elioraea thermophila]